MTGRFTKHVEDFVCERCGRAVSGDGYTNHCPTCLWSRHVDVHPGDRAALCGGMMEPVGVAHEKGGWVLTHRCVVCAHERRQRADATDDAEALVAVARQAAAR